MLKALLLLLMNLALAAMATAQTNLVPNGSFEDTVNCDLSITGLLKAEHWYNPNNGTPDIWDCDLERTCGFPMSPDNGINLSYQASYDGLRHTGAYYWFGPGSSNGREFLGIRLDEPLNGGQHYLVSLQCARSRNFRYAVDHIGVWLGPDSLWQNTTAWLSVTPQLKLRDPEQPYLTDGFEWHLLQDTLEAVGGEEWMVIGNFDPADLVNGTTPEPNASNSSAYYFIDDVSVEALLEQSIDESRLHARVLSDGLHLRWPSGFDVQQVEVFDAVGHLIFKQRLGLAGASSCTIPLSVGNGLYLVRVSGPERWLTGKVIKEEGF